MNYEKLILIGFSVVGLIVLFQFDTLSYIDYSLIFSTQILVFGYIMNIKEKLAKLEQKITYIENELRYRRLIK
jgi:hypothetical protein